MATLSLTGYTDTSASFRVSGTTSGVRYVVQVLLNNSVVASDEGTGNGGAISLSVSSLSPGTRYSYRGWEGSSTLAGDYFTTDTDSGGGDVTPTPSAYYTISEGYDSVSFTIYNAERGSSYSCAVYRNGTLVGTDDRTASSTTLTLWVDGLSELTDYTCVVNDSNGGVVSGPRGFQTTAAPNPRPSNFEWTVAKVKGGTLTVTATEWKNFCSRINAFRTYKGLSSYSFTSPTAGVTAISATIVNEARTAIDAISGHGTLPSAAVRGNDITASFFNTLRDALNAIS